MAGGELDDFARAVFENDLAILGGFCPCSFDSFPVLEDISFTGADGGDTFVIAVGHGIFLNHHSNDGAGGELFELATFGGGIRLRKISRAFVNEMSFATFVTTRVSVGFWIIIIDRVVADPVSEVNADIGNGLGDVTDIICRAFGVEVLLGDLGSFVGSEARESFWVRSGVAVVGVELKKVSWRGEEIIPETAGVVFAPHVGVIFVEIALTALADGGKGFVGTAGMGNRAIKRSVPVEIVWSERADGPDSAGSWILEDGGEAGDAGFGDSLEDYAGLSEADLRAGPIGATVRDLNAESRTFVQRGVGDFETGEIAINRVGVFELDVEILIELNRSIFPEEEKITNDAGHG